MDEFCGVLWPEDSVPKNEIDCNDCGLDEHGSRMIWGEGNPNANIFVLLDNPGARENRDGDPFVCGTRITLQKAIKYVGLTVDDVYVSWVLKRRPTRKYDKNHTRRICMRHLDDQLSKTKAQLVVCLGNIAVKSFFRDGDVEVKGLRGKVHHVNGFDVVTAYHPLAIRRRPNLWAGFVEDWELISETYRKF